MPPRLNRRSFMARVVGASALGGGALSLVLGRSFAQTPLSRSCLTDTDSTDRPDYGTRTGLTDTDTTDRAERGTLTRRTDSDAHDPANRGRSWRCAARTGVTDRDSGANADLAGYGRGGRANGVTDSDATDRPGEGHRNSLASDNDSTDRAGYGRSTGGRTGVTDNDSGPNADSAGRGRHSRNPVSTGFPDFPWPAPRPSEAPLKLPHDRVVASLGADKSLYGVGQHLTAAINAAGYAEYTFYGVPDGFALVSRLERIEEDGRPSPNGFRYMQPGQEPFSLANYLSGLFVAPVGRYRQIVFVVTDVPVVATAPPLTQGRAGQLLREGADRLPTDFRQMPFTNDHDVTALIYEFQKTGQVGNMAQTQGGPLTARDHLTRSGLYAAILSQH